MSDGAEHTRVDADLKAAAARETSASAGCGGHALRLSHLSWARLGIFLMQNYSLGVSHRTLLLVRYLVHLSTLKLDCDTGLGHDRKYLYSGNTNVSTTENTHDVFECVYPPLLLPPIAKVDIEVTT